MDHPPPRRFDWLDGLIFALALSAIWALWLPLTPRNNVRFAHVLTPPTGQLMWADLFLQDRGSGVLLPLGLATLACGLRRPRPDLAELLRRPGMSAMLAAPLYAVWTGIPVACRLIELAIRPPQPGTFLMPNFVGILMGGVGQWIGAVWLVQAMIGDRGPGDRWPDRLGYAIGWVWIVAWTLRVLAASIFEFEAM